MSFPPHGCHSCFGLFWLVQAARQHRRGRASVRHSLGSRRSVRKYRFATLAISWTYRQKWCPIPRIKRRRGGIAVDIRQLRYFVQIVESGSLSKASRQLYVAQPALSQQLPKLEDQDGKPLLHRPSNGVSPPENGPHHHHPAHSILRRHAPQPPPAR